MDATGAKKLIEATKEWFQQTAKTINPRYEIILNGFTVEDLNGEAFALPVPFSVLWEHPEWGAFSNTESSFEELIRRMQKKMEHEQYSQRDSIYITHSDKCCVLILGTENVAFYKKTKEPGALPKVKLSFCGPKKDEGKLPSFSTGDLIEIEGRSPLKGWVYAFSINANREIYPMYPGEGERSEVYVSQNSDAIFSDRILKAMGTTLPWRFSEGKAGPERFVLMVLTDKVPVVTAHLRRCIPVPLLFAHEVKTKGASQLQGNIFDQLRLDQVAIGTLDYYFEG